MRNFLYIRHCMFFFSQVLHLYYLTENSAFTFYIFIISYFLKKNF